LSGKKACKGGQSDAGLLLLRAGAGLSLCILFGLPKLKDAAYYGHTGQWAFGDFNRKAGLPAPVLVAYFQSLNESLGALFVACGLFTRYAAGSLFLSFVVAAYCSQRVGEEAWLMAGYFALMFATIALTGPGKLSIDFARNCRAAARASKPRNDKDEDHTGTAGQRGSAVA
jgi:uncharacterized membrane protein YphA (DoxX/SURF4 family)